TGKSEACGAVGSYFFRLLWAGDQLRHGCPRRGDSSPREAGVSRLPLSTHEIDDTNAALNENGGYLCLPHVKLPERLWIVGHFLRALLRRLCPLREAPERRPPISSPCSQRSKNATMS